MFSIARLYKVSADMAEKEKVIGGLLTLVQGGWIAGGLVISGVLFLTLASLVGSVFAFIFSVPPGIGFAYLFAFYKKMDLPFMTYLLYLRNMKMKTKTMVNTYNYGKDFKNQECLFEGGNKS